MRQRNPRRSKHVFPPPTLEEMKKEKRRVDKREASRDHYRLGTPEQRNAVILAEQGYGVEDVVVRTGVDASLAWLLVIGSPPK